MVYKVKKDSDMWSKEYPFSFYSREGLVGTHDYVLHERHPESFGLFIIKSKFKGL